MDGTAKKGRGRPKKYKKDEIILREPTKYPLESISKKDSKTGDEQKEEAIYDSKIQELTPSKRGRNVPRRSYALMHRGISPNSDKKPAKVTSTKQSPPDQHQSDIHSSSPGEAVYSVKRRRGRPKKLIQEHAGDKEGGRNDQVEMLQKSSEANSFSHSGTEEPKFNKVSSVKCKPNEETVDEILDSAQSGEKYQETGIMKSPDKKSALKSKLTLKSKEEKNELLIEDPTTMCEQEDAVIQEISASRISVESTASTKSIHEGKKPSTVGEPDNSTKEEDDMEVFTDVTVTLAPSLLAGLSTDPRATLDLLIRGTTVDLVDSPGNCYSLVGCWKEVLQVKKALQQMVRKSFAKPLQKEKKSEEVKTKSVSESGPQRKIKVEPIDEEMIQDESQVDDNVLEKPVNISNVKSPAKCELSSASGINEKQASPTVLSNTDQIIASSDTVEKIIPLNTIHQTIPSDTAQHHSMCGKSETNTNLDCSKSAFTESPSETAESIDVKTQSVKVKVQTDSEDDVAGRLDSSTPIVSYDDDGVQTIEVPIAHTVLEEYVDEEHASLVEVPESEEAHVVSLMNEEQQYNNMYEKDTINVVTIDTSGQEIKRELLPLDDLLGEHSMEGHDDNTSHDLHSAQGDGSKETMNSILMTVDEHGNVKVERRAAVKSERMKEAPTIAIAAQNGGVRIVKEDGNMMRPVEIQHEDSDAIVKQVAVAVDQSISQTETLRKFTRRAQHQRLTVVDPARVTHQCDECEYQSSLTGVMRHKQRRHSKSVFRCDICGTPFGIRYDRRRHRKIHFDKSGKLKPKAVGLLSNYRPEVDPSSINFTLVEEEEEVDQRSDLYDIIQDQDKDKDKNVKNATQEKVHDAPSCDGSNIVGKGQANSQGSSPITGDKQNESKNHVTHQCSVCDFRSSFLATVRHVQVWHGAKSSECDVCGEQVIDTDSAAIKTHRDGHFDASGELTKEALQLLKTRFPDVDPNTVHMDMPTLKESGEATVIKIVDDTTDETSPKKSSRAENKYILRCPRCKFACNSRSDLRRHKLKHVTAVLRCDRCHECYSDINAAKQHNDCHSGKNGEDLVFYEICVKCKEPLSSFADRAGFEAHFIDKHMDSVMCLLCRRHLESDAVADHFTKTHRVDLQAREAAAPVEDAESQTKVKKKKREENQPQLPKVRKKKAICKVCGKEVFLSYIKNHLKTHQPKTTVFKCSLCSFSSISKGRLTKHLILTHKKHAVTCNVCGMGFPYKGALKHHLFSKHGQGNGYSCEVCGREFYSRNVLENHVKCVHHNDKRHACPVCGHRFFSHARMVQHLETHAPDEQKHLLKRHRCSFCGKAFRVKQHLLFHENIHTGTTPYRCKVCPKAFTSTAALNKHARSHSNYRPHQCMYCKKAFKFSFKLQQHIVTHTRRSKHVCSVCTKPFTCYSTLKSHSCKGEPLSVDADLSRQPPPPPGTAPQGLPHLNHFLQGHTADQAVVSSPGTVVYQCGVCDAVFGSEAEVNAHIDTHSADAGASAGNNGEGLVLASGGGWNSEEVYVYHQESMDTDAGNNRSDGDGGGVILQANSGRVVLPADSVVMATADAGSRAASEEETDDGGGGGGELVIADEVVMETDFNYHNHYEDVKQQNTVKIECVSTSEQREMEAASVLTGLQGADI